MSFAPLYRDRRGHSSLAVATSISSYGKMERIIARGAPDDGRSLAIATKRDDMRAMRLLLEAYASWHAWDPSPALNEAVSPEAVRLLCEYQARPLTMSAAGLYPIHSAARRAQAPAL